MTFRSIKRYTRHNSLSKRSNVQRSSRFLPGKRSMYILWAEMHVRKLCIHVTHAARNQAENDFSSQKSPLLLSIELNSALYCLYAASFPHSHSYNKSAYLGLFYLLFHFCHIVLIHPVHIFILPNNKNPFYLKNNNYLFNKVLKFIKSCIFWNIIWNKMLNHLHHFRWIDKNTYDPSFVIVCLYAIEIDLKKHAIKLFLKP